MPTISVARAHANFARRQARINLEQVKWSHKSRVAELPSGDGGLPSGAGSPASSTCGACDRCARRCQNRDWRRQLS
jgi:hypothetical protein